MIQVPKIQDKLYKLVGLRQPFNPALPVLDADNKTSRSGYIVNDNPLVKLDYLKDTQDFVDISDTQFNTLLRNMQRDSIASIANVVFNDADYIDRNLLFKKAINKVDVTTLTDGFVGWGVELDDKKNVAFEITRILLNFQGTGDFKLLLFNTSQDTPIFEKVITISSTHQEVQLNWVIDNSADTYKGDYYLGYLTTGLTIQPFDREFENADVKSIITHMHFRRIEVVGHNTETLWDIDDNEGLSDDIGLNPDITVYDDFTDLILQNERLFAEAINLDFQINFMSTYTASLRSNKEQRKSMDLINRVLLEINGQRGERRIVGLAEKLFISTTQIKKEVKKLKEGYFSEGIFVSTIS